jgi:hypothetical protein
MARPNSPTPSYLLHKPTGQARVRLRFDGRFRDVYLGEYGSPESLEQYHRLLAEHYGGNGNDRVPPAPVATSAAATEDWRVAELVVKYDDFASLHYVKNGERTDDRYRAAIQPLVSLYGSTLARDFGPKKFKTLRRREELKRKTIQLRRQANLSIA